MSSGRLEHFGSFIKGGVVCDYAVDAGNIDDRTFSLLNHVGNEGVAQSEQSDHVPASAVQPIFGRLGLKALGDGDYRIIHQDVQTVELLNHIGVKLGNGFG